MQELSRYLFLAGGLVFLLLGTTHAVYTPHRTSDRKGLSPVDPTLVESMARSKILLSSRQDVWRAWVAFNLTHSLGLLLLGLVVVMAGRTPVSFAHYAAVVVPLAVVFSLAYLSVGVAYLYRIPTIALGLSVVLFSCAWVFTLGGSRAH